MAKDISDCLTRARKHLEDGYNEPFGVKSNNNQLAYEACSEAIDLLPPAKQSAQLRAAQAQIAAEGRCDIKLPEFIAQISALQ